VAKRAGDTIHRSLVKVMSGIEKTRNKNLDRRRRDVCNRLVTRHAHMAPAAFIFDYTFHLRISIHLRADFGLPQGICGGIGHHGGSPLGIVGYILAGLVR